MSIRADFQAVEPDPFIGHPYTLQPPQHVGAWPPTTSTLGGLTTSARHGNRDQPICLSPLCRDSASTSLYNRRTNCCIDQKKLACLPSEARLLNYLQIPRQRHLPSCSARRKRHPWVGSHAALPLHTTWMTCTSDARTCSSPQAAELREGETWQPCKAPTPSAYPHPRTEGA